MKTTVLRNTVMALVLTSGLSFTSCKDKTEETTTDTETVVPENGSEAPMDTIVTEDDTIIETGTNKDTKENPVGTQVP